MMLNHFIMNMNIYLFKMFHIFWMLALLVVSGQAFQDITSFGAVKNEDTLSAQQTNQVAIMQAIAQANLTTSAGDDRVVIVPTHTYYTLPIVLDHVYDVVLEVRGKLSACNRIKHYPKTENRISYQDFISINFGRNITLRGGGKIDGRGYIWWLNAWLVTKKYMPPHANRPHLIASYFVERLVIHDLVLKNSPSFHIKADQTIDSTFYNLDIKVNTTAQMDIFKRNYLTGIIPMFPLNTDGIDPSGRNFHIYNITCQNYDDVVVPKPSHTAPGSMSNCTENILVQNITVRLGVGLSIGSVPPNENVNCIRNVTFRNAHFQKPFKGIYIKTNPGDKGSGRIQDILYENITMHEPIWWAIYLGPQQQKQPDKGGPGCMLYPFDPKGTCQTQPRINITNIKLKNVQIHNSLLFPIVMRCNETNPCTNITFQNVQARGWAIGNKGKGYVCEHVSGSQSSSFPKLDCLEGEGPSEQFRSQSEDDVDIKMILDRMQKASQKIPYLEEDDEMLFGEKHLEQDLQSFREHIAALQI